MKEGYIKDKVIQFAGKFRSHVLDEKIQREKLMLHLIQDIDMEFQRCYQAFHKHMLGYIDYKIKSSLK